MICLIHEADDLIIHQFQTSDCFVEMDDSISDTINTYPNTYYFYKIISEDVLNSTGAMDDSAVNYLNNYLANRVHEIHLIDDDDNNVQQSDLLDIISNSDICTTYSYDNKEFKNSFTENKKIYLEIARTFHELFDDDLKFNNSNLFGFYQNCIDIGCESIYDLYYIDDDMYYQTSNPYLSIVLMEKLKYLIKAKFQINTLKEI